MIHSSNSFTGKMMTSNLFQLLRTVHKQYLIFHHISLHTQWEKADAEDSEKLRVFIDFSHPKSHIHARLHNSMYCYYNWIGLVKKKKPNPQKTQPQTCKIHTVRTSAYHLPFIIFFQSYYSKWLVLNERAEKLLALSLIYEPY